MCPAKCERSSASFSIRRLDMLVRAIAIALDDAGVVAEQLFCPDFAAPGHVAVNDPGWIAAAMGAVIACNRPKIPGLGFSGARRQNLGDGLVYKQSGAR